MCIYKKFYKVCHLSYINHLLSDYMVIDMVGLNQVRLFQSYLFLFNLSCIIYIKLLAETLLGGEFGYLILENIFLTDSVINVGPKSNLGLLIFLAVLLTMSQSSWDMSDNINHFKHPLGLIHHVWTCNPMCQDWYVILTTYGVNKLDPYGWMDSIV